MKKEELFIEIISVCLIIALAIICIVFEISNREVSVTPETTELIAPKSNPIQDYNVNRFYREYVHKPSVPPVESSTMLNISYVVEDTVFETNAITEPLPMIVDVIGMLIDLESANDKEAHFTILDYANVEYDIVINTEEMARIFDPNRNMYFRVIGTLVNNTITVSRIVPLVEFEANSLANELYNAELPVG